MRRSNKKLLFGVGIGCLIVALTNAEKNDLELLQEVMGSKTIETKIIEKNDSNIGKDISILTSILSFFAVLILIILFAGNAI